MVYNKVGQIRQTPDDNNVNLNASNYFTRISCGNITIQTTSPFDNTKFLDFALKINSNNENNTTFQQTETYYLRVIIKKANIYKVQSQTNSSIDNNVLSYKLKLRNSTNTKYQQLISNFRVPSAVSDDQDQYYTYSLIFKPNSNNYDSILFELDKNSYDYLNRDGSGGWRNWLNILEGEEGNETLANIDYDEDGILCSLNNIIQGNKKLSKIGFQSRPGELIAINGYPIRVGKSGIYELDNGTIISSVMITPNAQNTVDAFLLDYMYSIDNQEEEG